MEVHWLELLQKIEIRVIARKKGIGFGG